MLIAGGIYAERCRFPRWNQLYGSGLRSAVALSSVTINVELHAYAAEPWHNDIVATLDSFGIARQLTQIEKGVTFDYLHPFELAACTEPTEAAQRLEVEGQSILRFGLIEGDARVRGNRVVYDPQSPKPAPFAANGSEAENLALILTERELFSLAGMQCDEDDRSSSLREAITELFDTKPRGEFLLLLKDRLGGARLYTSDDNPLRIPPVAAESYFRIGSGDVFAAAFAHAWAEEKSSPMNAAEYAAQCVAYFVDGPRLPLPPKDRLPKATPGMPQAGVVRLLGQGMLEFETLLLHTADWIVELGGKATVDLFGDFTGGTEDTTSFLILVGPRWDQDMIGRYSEITSGLPTVVYWPDAPGGVQNIFPNAHITTDYTTALYLTLRGFDQ